MELGIVTLSAEEYKRAPAALISAYKLLQTQIREAQDKKAEFYEKIHNKTIGNKNG